MPSSATEGEAATPLENAKLHRREERARLAEEKNQLLVSERVYPNCVMSKVALSHCPWPTEGDRGMQSHEFSKMAAELLAGSH